jgi:hypothetical protein
MQPLRKVVFADGMETDNMVKMEMTDEKIGSLTEINIPVQLCNAVACIKDNGTGRCVDKNADCISRIGIIPTVCS